MDDLQERKLNLTLQLVIKIAKKTIPKAELDELCDWYGFWEDDEEFASGEKKEE